MQLAALEPRGFRNLADARVELGPELVVLHGPNGAGKTNLLEAVYFGLANRSFRSGNDRDLIAFDQPSARVELELEQGGERSTLLSALERGGERRHRIDGRQLEAGGPERPLVSVFHPDRLQLVKGPAAHRRAHLDRLVAALWPARADLRSRFGRTLAQRNALVSRIRAGMAAPSSLPAWDERLAEEAEPLIASRAEALATLAGPFASFAADLGLEAAEVSYRPRHAAGREELAAELAERRGIDLGRAYTSYGPQLDEVELRLGGRALRRFGSQGQQRAALLALLFAERSALIDAGRRRADHAARRRDERARPRAPRAARAHPLRLGAGALDGDGGRARARGSGADDDRRRCRSREPRPGARCREPRRGRLAGRGRLMAKRRAPRPVAEALRLAVEPLAPATTLGAVQAVWADAVGDAIAAEATPVAERDGVITVACRSATWAQELDLLGDRTLKKLASELPAGVEVAALRFTVGSEPS